MACRTMDLGSHMQMRNHVMGTGALTCTYTCMHIFPDSQALPVNNKMAEHYNTTCKYFSACCHGYSRCFIIIVGSFNFSLKRPYHACILCCLAFGHVSIMGCKGTVSTVQEKTCTQQCCQATRPQRMQLRNFTMHGNTTCTCTCTCMKC